MLDHQIARYHAAQDCSYRRLAHAEEEAHRTIPDAIIGDLWLGEPLHEVPDTIRSWVCDVDGVSDRFEANDIAKSTLDVVLDRLGLTIETVWQSRYWVERPS